VGAWPILRQPMVAGPHEGFAKRLKEALTDQREEERGGGARLARICGVSSAAAGKWLSGDGLPHMTHAMEMAEELGVCVEWLLTGRGPKKPPGPKTVTLIETIDSLPPDSQVILQKVADSFVKSAQLIPWDEVTERRRRGKA
jgi:transcriptional regulator with XRE-family HTH domain